MNLAAAYDILELTGPATIEDVSESFRRLLKEYHPDRNIDRSEWSHQMTVQLNEAYEVAVTHLQNEEPVSQRVATATPEEPEFDPWQDADVEYGFSVGLQTRMATLFDLLVDQVFAFYTYGLNNAYLRTEGTLRYRYRTIQRRLKEVLTEVRGCREWPASRRQRAQVDAVALFGAGFYENILIKTPPTAVLSEHERKAYALYRTGADSLDQAIKSALFGPQFNGHGVGHSSPRNICERSFLNLMAHYSKSIFVAEALIKMYLLRGYDALSKHVLT